MILVDTSTRIILNYDESNLNNLGTGFNLNVNVRSGTQSSYIAVNKSGNVEATPNEPMVQWPPIGRMAEGQARTASCPSYHCG